MTESRDTSVKREERPFLSDQMAPEYIGAIIDALRRYNDLVPERADTRLIKQLEAGLLSRDFSWLSRQEARQIVLRIDLLSVLPGDGSSYAADTELTRLASNLVKRYQKVFGSPPFDAEGDGKSDGERTV